MYRDKKKSKILVTSALLFLMASCAVSKFAPPNSDVQSILILPYTNTNTSGSPNRYVLKYGIIKPGGTSNIVEATFNLNSSEGFVMVDSLPPGRYYVTQVIAYHAGSGARDNDRTYLALKKGFGLEPGTITIYRRSLNVFQESHPTKAGYVRTSWKTRRVSFNQKTNILEELKKLENFDAWKISSMKELIIDQMQGQWTGSWGATTEVGINGINCSNGKVHFEIKGYELRGQAEAPWVSRTVNLRYSGQSFIFFWGSII